MPEVCRQSFAVYFLAAGFIFGINNLFIISGKPYFLGSIEKQIMLTLCYFLGIGTFIFGNYRLNKNAAAMIQSLIVVGVMFAST